LIKKVGILAIQGDYVKHGQTVKKLGHEPINVRNKKELNSCDSLIIPGGESSTFLNLIERLDLRSPLIQFGKNRPIFGTCAGLIILAKKVDNLEFNSLGLIDIAAKRNAYGRQVDSFIDMVDLRLENITSKFEGVFIRAPKIEEYNGSVKPLGFHKDNVVLAANDNILVSTFHPELTNDLSIHQYFLEKF